MLLMKIMFHLLEAFLQTGTSKGKLAALSVTGTKSFLALPRVRY